jgi:acetylornithine/succinyldiaminopimelate/putrescine aminotransferase/acyl-CoA synthetase (AMP-forming)/AMP-acid ligase II/predicted amino acid dehydrogenase
VNVATLGELLERRARDEPDRLGFVFLTDSDSGEERLTYGELVRRSDGIAESLTEVAATGDRALLLFPAGLDFVAAFFACIRAGVVAVPVASPLAGRLDRSLPALDAIVRDCEPVAVLTTRAIREEADRAELTDGLGAARWLAVDELSEATRPAPPHHAAPDDLAYLQYTSGSTASPRGAMILHANLLANLEAIRRVTRQTREGTSVMWLPHYHDMGLTGFLASLYVGQRCVFMSPLAFMARPLRWLKAVTEYRATWTGAPNFAFDLCVRRVRPPDVERLDLSSLSFVATGAEPVRAGTLDRFAETFAPAGLRAEALAPCYGLAECVVFATGPREPRPPRVVRFDADALQDLRAAEAAPDGDGRALVACGMPPEGHEVLVVDPDTREPCADERVGEVWLAGPSIAAGYWNRPDDTEAVFRARVAGDGARGPYLRTGDLGFVKDGDLFLTGRLKDLIIIGGANYYPQDIEWTVEECHPAIRPASAAVFAVDEAPLAVPTSGLEAPPPIRLKRPVDTPDVGGSAQGGERLVVMAEVRRNATSLDEVRRAICAAVADRHQLTVGGVGLLASRTAPKTSSGKIRRRAARQAWLNGDTLLLARWESPELRDGDRAAATDGDPGTAGREAFETAVLERVRRAVGERAEAIDVEEPLTRLGLGSLELAEVKASIEDDLGVSVPLSRLLQGWSIRDLARSLAGEDGFAAAPAASAPAAKPYERFVNPAIGALLRQLRMDKSYVRGEGCWLEDADGERYLDALAAYGAVPFGHNPPEIWRALNEVHERGQPSFVQPSSLDAAGELAERLLSVAPPGLRYATFANSGAEAAEAAIKLARAVTGRAGILSTVGGFHGKTLAALSATGRPAYQEPFLVPLPGFEVVPYGDLDALEGALSASADEFAAFIVEPIQGEGGIVEPPPGYLRGARELCTRHGVLLIVDEVQTGLGRTGRMFACEDEDVTPDVLMVAKALGGGVVPIGAILYGEHVFSEEFALKHTSTFAGGTLAARVGLAVLDLLTRDGGALVAGVRAKGERLRSGLERVAVECPAAVVDVRGRGFMLGLELTSEWEAIGHRSLLGLMAEQGRLAALVSSHLLEVERVRVAPTILSSEVIRVEPPLTLDEDLCDRVVEAFGTALGHVERGDTAALVNHLLARPRALAARSFAPARSACSPPPADEPDGRFGFVVHPLDHDSYRQFDPSLAVFSTREIAEVSSHWGDLVEPFVVGSARIVSDTGAVADGEFVVVPRTAGELHAVDHGAAVALVGQAVQVARERGAGVVGLGAHVSVVTGAGTDLRDPGVPVTPGNAFTALSTYDTVVQACAALELPPAEATAAVLGAAGSVGRALSLLLAGELGRLILVGNPAHPELSLRALRLAAERAVAALAEAEAWGSGPIARRVSELLAADGAAADALVDVLLEEELLTLTTDAERFLPLADVVVATTSSPDTVVGPEHLRPGAIACDVARPLNVSPAVARERPDVLVLEGGLVEVPGGIDLGWDFGLPPGTAFACMCEPMLLALEGRPEAGGSGFEAPPRLLADLRAWAVRHGFRAAAPRTFGRAVTEDDWRRLREARQAQREAGVTP